MTHKWHTTHVYVTIEVFVIEPLGSGPPHRGPGVYIHFPPVSLWFFDIPLPYPPLMSSPPCTAKSSLPEWSSIRFYSIVSIGDGFG